MPFDSFDIKKVVNSYPNKRQKIQKFKYSGLEEMNKNFGNLYSFFLNRERVSDSLNLYDNEIKVIKNDW